VAIWGVRTQIPSPFVPGGRLGTSFNVGSIHPLEFRLEFKPAFRPRDAARFVASVVLRIVPKCDAPVAKCDDSVVRIVPKCDASFVVLRIVPKCDASVVRIPSKFDPSVSSKMGAWAGFGIRVKGVVMGDRVGSNPEVEVEPSRLGSVE
jgi:hypothetical protein